MGCLHAQPDERILAGDKTRVHKGKKTIKGVSPLLAAGGDQSLQAGQLVGVQTHGLAGGVLLGQPSGGRVLQPDAHPLFHLVAGLSMQGCEVMSDVQQCEQLSRWARGGSPW